MNDEHCMSVDADFIIVLLNSGPVVFLIQCYCTYRIFMLVYIQYMPFLPKINL